MKTQNNTYVSICGAYAYVYTAMPVVQSALYACALYRTVYILYMYIYKLYSTVCNYT